MSEARLRVSVIGLGKLGACMAAALAERGHTVFGVDVRQEVVDLLALGKAPVIEPGLQDMITRNRDRITATQDIDAAVEATDLTFVVVPTPSEPNGAFSLEHAAAAFRALGQALRSRTRYHLVVLTSTVLPGSTRYRLIAELEASSGRRCGPDFGVCYSPEFIALGSVIKDFLHRKAKGGELYKVTADRFYPRVTLAALAAIAQETSRAQADLKRLKTMEMDGNRLFAGAADEH